MRIALHNNLTAVYFSDITINYETDYLEKYPHQICGQYSAETLIELINIHSEFKLTVEFYMWLKATKMTDLLYSAGFNRFYAVYQAHIAGQLSKI